MKLKIQALENGPVVIAGTATYAEGGEHRTTPGSAFALCRCGTSQRKPFCDGSHKGCGFQGGAVELEVSGSD